MLYPSYITVAVAAVLSLQYVAAIPLEVKMGDGNAANKQSIKDAMPLVNQKIKNMKAVTDLPDAQAKAHPAVVKAFGANANIPEIRKNVDILHTGKIMVPHTDAADGVTQGATYPHNGHVVFGSSFYSSDKNTQAGTIIHEASHAKAGTVDHFKTDGTPGHKTDPGVRVGYKDSHMSELNAKHSDQMHHNADAYRVFGDECPNVRRSLYRRAMEESHPVVRSELLRRAAHACAWKPKGKAAAAKHAATEHKATTGAQKSLSAKKPLHAKGATSKASAKGVHTVSSKKSPLSGGAKRLSASKKVAHAGAHTASKGKVAHAGAHAASKGKSAGAHTRVTSKKASGGKVAHAASKKAGGKVAHAGAHAASKKVAHTGSSKRLQTKAKPVHAKAATKAKTVHKAVAKGKPVHKATAAKPAHQAKAKPVVQHKAASKPAPKRVSAKKH